MYQNDKHGKGKAAVATGLVVLVAAGGAGCGKEISTVPDIGGGSITFADPLFRNQVIRTPNITGDYDKSEWRINDGEWKNGPDFYDVDGAAATLQYRLKKNNIVLDNISGTTNTVHDGEAVTDNKVDTSLTAKVGAGKVNAGYTTNFSALGYEWDALFQRTSDSKWVWVWVDGKQDDLTKPDFASVIPVTDDYIVVTPGENIQDKIDQKTP
ncbi:hypothetical protein ACFLZ7_03145 [Nanoarchaeota archaeon]